MLDLTITAKEESFWKEGQTPSRVETKAKVHEYSFKGVFHSQPFNGSLFYQEWMNGEIDILASEINGPDVLTTVVGRLRLTVYTLDDNKSNWVVLRVAELKSTRPAHANLTQWSLEELATKLDFSITNALNTCFKDIDIDTRASLFAEKNRTRNQIAMTYPANDHRIVLTAFILTRIYPLL